MSSRLNAWRCGCRAMPFGILSGGCALGVAMLVVSFSPIVYAQIRTAREGVYSDAQATRGQGIYKERCSPCHGDTLGGGLAPPLTGDDFMRNWGTQPLADLANKIRNTMPADKPGTLTAQQSTDLVAYLLRAGKFPAGRAELSADEAALKQIAFLAAPPAGSTPQTARTAPQGPSFPPSANLAQLMRGMLFPTSNLIFNVQTNDPSTRKKADLQSGTSGFSWVDWGADIYSPWELVDYAAMAIAEAAPRLLTPGRRCENGKPVPVDQPDWVKFTLEMMEAGKAAYKASQSRSQEVVSEATNQLSESCLNCHVVYRDKPGGTPADPSNKAARCVK
ncbi:MAG TPA: cytochrome c [Vicinamibacterales bacterium]|nr:cytochrome c [Vicinamibacterales bacterium]